MLGLIYTKLHDSSDWIEPEDQKREVVDLLLRALAKENRRAIKEDRQYIASFNEIQCLRTWSDGTVRDGFSAHSVMHLASARQVTKAVDTAYSLMGILGVRFPAFHAEGLTKALSRLMDAVVVASNDVSIFNWSGKHCASPIRGRSLYASNISGFHVDFSREKESLDVDRELMRRFRDSRKKELHTAREVRNLLVKTWEFASKSNPGHDTLESLKVLAEFIRKNDFNILCNTLRADDLVAVMGDIIEFTDQISPNIDKAGEEQSNEAGNPPSHPQVVLEKVSQPEGNDNPSNEYKAEDDTANTAKPKLGLLGRRMPKTITDLTSEAKFQWSKKSGKAVDEKREAKKKAAEEQEKAQRAEAVEIAKQEENSERNKRTLEQLEERIRNLIQETIQGKIKDPSPSEGRTSPDKENTESSSRRGQQTVHNASEDHPSNQRGKETQSSNRKDLDRRIICRNPIVVSGAGIKGVFDIQRVVVTMLQPKILRSKVRNAVSEHEKIDGWCTISTGFTLNMVAFSCERGILEQQLDLVDVVRETVLTDPDDRTMGVQSDDKQGNAEQREESEQQPLKRKPTGASLEGQTNERELEKQYGNSIEQRKVSRMIDFVTTSNLDVVAGEWVLARFSDSPGAKWFLCRLELGSGSQFHGRRIPTDEFDFEDAIPEIGLVEYWHTFLRAQKAIMCDALSWYLGSKKANKNLNLLGKHLDLKFWEVGKDVRDTSHREGEDRDCEEEQRLEEKNKYAQMSAMWQLVRLFVWAIRSGFSEAWAKHLQKHLREKALAKVPVRLQAAILALENNETLLPVMFHSGREVHFF